MSPLPEFPSAMCRMAFCAANKAMSGALDATGHDRKFVFDEDNHCGKHGAPLFPDTMRWFWPDYLRWRHRSSIEPDPARLL
jgi:hypothetical protein